jgi:hypothetical protein
VVEAGDLEIPDVGVVVDDFCSSGLRPGIVDFDVPADPDVLDVWFWFPEPFTEPGDRPGCE